MMNRNGDSDSINNNDGCDDIETCVKDVEYGDLRITIIIITIIKLS